MRAGERRYANKAIAEELDTYTFRTFPAVNLPGSYVAASSAAEAEEMRKMASESFMIHETVFFSGRWECGEVRGSVDSFRVRKL